MTSSILVDRVKVLVTTSGVGPFGLGAPAAGFRGAEALVNGAQYSYSVASGSLYEVGTGIYNAGSGQLVRTPEISSNGNAAVAFPAGVQLVFTARAADLIATGGTFPIVNALGNDPNVAAAQQVVTAALNGKVSPADLAQLSAAGGIGWAQNGANADSRTVAEKLYESVSLDDFILPSDPVISGYPDVSNAFARASLITTEILGVPGRVYYVKDVSLDGRQFNGRNCVLRDAPGARWGIRAKGYAPALRNYSFQDQGNYVATTTLASGAAGSASTISVTSAAGMYVNQVIFVDIDANEVRFQTLIAGIVGTTVTLRDPLPGAAGAGKRVDAMFAANWVGTADHWEVSNVLVINARGGLLVMPEAPGIQISNRGSVYGFETDGSHYFSILKTADAAGFKPIDAKLWGGFVETTNAVGNGTAGPFSFGKKVFLLRDVTVTVNGTNQIYGTDWEYASQTAIQFKSGHFPANGAAIAIYHFRDAYRGAVDDQRQTNLISGGNVWDMTEALDAFIAIHAIETELTEFRSAIGDGAQYVACQLDDVSNTTVFDADTYLGFSGSSLKLNHSNPKTFGSLYSKRVPQAEQWLPSLDDNIAAAGSSTLGILAGLWTGEFQTSIASDSVFNLEAAQEIRGMTKTNITSPTPWYLSEGGASTVLGDNQMRVIGDRTLKLLWAFADDDAVTGSFTYRVLANNVPIGTVVISGTDVYMVRGVFNAFVQNGTAISYELVAATGAPLTARHYVVGLFR